MVPLRMVSSCFSLQLKDSEAGPHKLKHCCSLFLLVHVARFFLSAHRRLSANDRKLSWLRHGQPSESAILNNEHESEPTSRSPFLGGTGALDGTHLLSLK